jgi:hypothetical protein
MPGRNFFALSKRNVTANEPIFTKLNLAGHLKREAYIEFREKPTAHVVLDTG